LDLSNIADITNNMIQNISESVVNALDRVASSDFDVYLTNTKDNDTFHFPVNPLSLTINREKKYNTVEIIDIGEIDVNDKGTKIRELSIETLIPDVYEPYCRYTDIASAKDTIEKLEKWQDQVEPLRLIITGIAFNNLVNLGAMNEEVKPEGLYNGKYFTFTFRTYKELKVELYNPSSSTSLKNNRTTATASSRTYTVKSGDNLWNIAKWWWGDGARWPDLYNKNKSVIGSNPNLIYPGQKLVIP
jgi:LysM repeat protein